MEARGQGAISGLSGSGLGLSVSSVDHRYEVREGQQEEKGRGLE